MKAYEAGSIIAGIIATLLALGAMVAYLTPDNSLGQANLGTPRACQASTVAVVGVGNQSSTQVLATSSLRAWARIQQKDTATNTVNVVLGNGVAATTLTGLQLHKNTAATGTIHALEFGLATERPYTGAVTAITDIGSTTVFVTECTYRN